MPHSKNQINGRCTPEEREREALITTFSRYAEQSDRDILEELRAASRVDIRQVEIIRGSVFKCLSDREEVRVAAPMIKREKIGRGKQGYIRLYECPSSGLKLSVKEAADGRRTSRMSEEVRNRISKIVHPNLSVYHGIGAIGGIYPTMVECHEYIPGESLGHLLKNKDRNFGFGGLVPHIDR